MRIFKVAFPLRRCHLFLWTKGNKSMNTITRVFEFDAAHRVMNEAVKCYNLHGHRFRVEVTIGYSRSGSLGYAVDFKEIKRVIGHWIDSHLDHTCILNPMDEDLINLCRESKWNLYIMGMGHEGDYNPSAENLASELLYIFKTLMDDDTLSVVGVKLYETPNCWVEATKFDYVATAPFLESIRSYKKAMGHFEYDIRNR